MASECAKNAVLDAMQSLDLVPPMMSDDAIMQSDLYGDLRLDWFSVLGLNDRLERVLGIDMGEEIGMQESPMTFQRLVEMVDRGLSIAVPT